MRPALTWILAFFLIANGLFMLGAPEAWYHFIPTVPFTGPFNPHFVRDIGCGYLTCGTALLWLARDPARGTAATLITALFLGLHAVIHLWDTLAGRTTLAALIQDLPAVFLPPLIMLWLAWPSRRLAS
jgi:hypothetical protein